MSKIKMGTHEAILVILTMLIPLTVISTPKIYINELKSSALLNILYVTIISVCISFLIYKLFKSFPEKDILDISDFLGGKIFRNIIGSIFIFYFIVSSSIFIRDFSESLNVIYYPYTDVKYIALSFIFTLGVINSYGFSSSIVKTTVLIAPALFLSLILLFAGNIENFSFYRIFPILGDGIYNTFFLGLTNIGSFAGIIYLYLLPPLLKEPQKFKRVALLSTIISGILILICISSLLLMFSIFITVDEIMPLFTIGRYIEFGTFFQRFESIFLLIWTVSFCCYLVIACKFSSYIFTKMFNLKDSSPVFIIFTFLLYAITLLPPNFAVTDFYESYIHRYFTIGVIILGIIILSLSNLKKKVSKI